MIVVTVERQGGTMPDRALDGQTILHLLGVGGITTICLFVGYGLVWVAIHIVEWWERG
ncbi:MAG TPA: hypothetical protein VN444_04550 [Verrucomicrobiae bacterium]|nr:hypothetical protein [Verrucomicrobiae bacterium]